MGSFYKQETNEDHSKSSPDPLFGCSVCLPQNRTDEANPVTKSRLVDICHCNSDRSNTGCSSKSLVSENRTHGSTAMEHQFGKRKVAVAITESMVDLRMCTV